MSRADLARRQADLVNALVDGTGAIEGFDPHRVRAAARALLRKRAGQVAATWPSLRASLGPQWNDRFAAWAVGRAPQGALRDGWDFARSLGADLSAHAHLGADLGPHLGADLGPHLGAEPPAPLGADLAAGLGQAAAVELAGREVTFVYDGVTAPRRRRAPALRWVAGRNGAAGPVGMVVIQLFGRVGELHLPRALTRLGRDPRQCRGGTTGTLVADYELTALYASTSPAP